MESKEIKGFFILILVTFIWGSTFSFTKIALKVFTPFFLLFLRFLFGALFLFLFLKLKKQRISVNRSGIILGLINFSAIAFQTFGLQYTTATKTAFITGISVLLVPFFEKFIFKNKIYWNLWLAVIIGFIGLIFLTTDFSVVSKINWGDFLVFICAVLYALQIVYISYVVEHREVFDLAFSEILFTAIFSFLFFLFFEPRNLPLYFIFQNSLPIVYLGVVATAFTLTLQLIGQKYVPPTKSALIYNLEPVFATLFAFILLSEKLTHLQIIGALLILMSLFISIPSSFQNKS
ncbi:MULTISPECIES: DMT family transporter [Dictyoglomus]|jgi:drug/metabolite transporter (DMT)-like permease|uniref:DMT family transporter n=1 Tax=Dictyoglomus TaxID=13 RepID=UPI00235601D4|nr:DMT family transporter [Dictyoglomus turgidum]